MQEPRLSRRATLAGFAALAPATALAALPPIAANADAELLALGKEFAPLFHAHREFEFRDDDDGACYDALCDELFPLADAILAHRAMTREGLALQVRALVATYGSVYLTRHSDMTSGDVGMANFIASVASFCGVEDNGRCASPAARRERRE